jgi:hypothetical protein
MSLTQVNPNENLARYIFSRNQFSPTKKLVKYTAFMPPANRRLSVFRISGLSENEVWGIGENVGKQRSLPLLAHADIKASSVSDSGLTIDIDDIPRHANIVGWRGEDSAVRLQALELADKAQLRLK